MSDIYLQITETPTVVTLSAPVISGALSSTVTVANVVTVALDSNSLSALENVTVTVGAAITGTVTVSNFPASQAVTFSAVTISNFPTSQTIAGTVTANLGFAGNYDNGGDALRIDIGALNGETLDLDGNIPIKMGTVTAPFPISGTVTVGNTVTIAGTVTANPTGTQTVAGTVTANLASVVTINSSGASFSQRVVSKSALQFTAIAGAIDPTRFSSDYTVLPVKITSETDGLNLAVDLRKTSQGNDVSAISNDATAAFVRTQVVGGSVTIGSLPALVAGTAQIGSVTASISNSVTIASLPAISGTVTANAGTGTFVISDKGTTGEGTVTSFTSTSSAVLKASNSNRKLLTIFNEGSGTIFILLGSGTASTTNYSLRLLSGDYYELEKYTGEVNAIFGSAGTAKITEIT